MQTPVLLVAHGSRVPEAVVAADELRERVEALRDGRVDLGYLELAAPSGSAALAAMAQDGVEEVVVQPLLLLPGNHTKFDVTAIAREAVGLGMKTRIGQPLGSDARLLSVAEAHVLAAAGDNGLDALLVIASGTASDTALRSLDSSAALVAHGVGVSTVAAAAATLDGQTAVEALASMAQDGHRRVVVLPWMLFPGRLEDATVAALRGQAASLSLDLVVAERFGAGEGVAHAVVRRVERARAFEG